MGAVPSDHATAFTGTSRFQLVRQLGAGGMGIVYEALDRERNVHVALKTIQTLTADSLLKFKNEFRALQDVRHPNLVYLGELQEAAGTWFFTMELVQGVDFLSYVRGAKVVAEGSDATSPLVAAALGTPAAPPAFEAPDDPTFPTAVASHGSSGSGGSGGGAGEGAVRTLDERRLCDALCQLARGLSALHAARMVHRDIKPGNVLVGEQGRVVILDFGLVMNAAARPIEGHGVGTAAFMAPEQAAGEAVGAAADWYSVGATLYLALTGRPPYIGTTEQIQTQRQLRPITPPSELAPEVPAYLSELAMGLLARTPAERFTGADVLARLGAVTGYAGAGSELEPRQVSDVFIGRDAELAELRTSVARVRAGAAVALMVSGESGVGKSALVRQLLAGLVGDGTALVLAGRCYERESVPYKAVDGVVDALARELARWPDEEVEALLPARMALLAAVFPVLLDVRAIAAAVARAGAVRTAEATQFRSQVFAVMRALLERLAARAPLVLSVDDLQWADVDSLALLANLLRPPGAPALLFLATVRPIAGGEALTPAALRQRLGVEVRELELTGLPPGDARELAAHLVAHAQGAPGTDLRADSIAGEAEGHPLFIDALIRHRLSHPHDAGPVRLDDALVARAHALGEPVVRVLELICLAGGPLQQEACAQAAGISFAELTERADALRAAGLVKTHGPRRGDRVEPYHDRVREAIAGPLAADARVQAHARLARALEASPSPDPEMLAVHFRAAGDPRRAARYAARAADRAAAALAFERAARLYREALAEPAAPQVESSLRVRLAEALSNSGRGAEAAEAYLIAARLAPERTFELHRLASEQFLRSGRVDDAARTIDAVLALVGKKLPRTRAAAIVAFLVGRTRLRLRGMGFERRDEREVPPELLRRIDLCHTLMPLGLTDPLRAQPFNNWQLRLALDSGVPAQIARALLPEITFVSSGGMKNAARADHLAELGLRLADESGDPYARSLMLGANGLSSYCLGRWRKCREYCEASFELLSEEVPGSAWEQDAVVLYDSRAGFLMGDLAELHRQLPLALKNASDRGDVYMQANLKLAMSSAHVWLADDDGDAVRRHASEAIRGWNVPGINLQHVQELWSLLSVELYEGKPEAAERRLAETWPKIASSLYVRMQVLRLMSVDFRARVAVAAAAAKQGNERRERLAEARRHARHLRGEKVAWGGALADRIDAALACARGDVAGACVLLERAEGGFATAEMALHATIMRRQRGLLVGGDAGAALVAESEASMRAQTIVRAERFAALYAPGLGGEGALR